MKESDIEKAVVKESRKFGWVSFKILSTQRRGLPDRMFIKEGVVVFIEFKNVGGKLSPSQEVVHRIFEEQGIRVYVVSDVEEGLNILRSYDMCDFYYRVKEDLTND